MPARGGATPTSTRFKRTDADGGLASADYKRQGGKCDGYGYGAEKQDPFHDGTHLS